jgi:hypothetical protein
MSPFVCFIDFYKKLIVYFYSDILDGEKTHFSCHQKKSVSILAWSLEHISSEQPSREGKDGLPISFYVPLQPDRFRTCPTNGKSLVADEITFQGFSGCGSTQSLNRAAMAFIYPNGFSTVPETCLS